jgi:hypothetical protein
MSTTCDFITTNDHELFNCTTSLPCIIFWEWLGIETNLLNRSKNIYIYISEPSYKSLPVA